MMNTLDLLGPAIVAVIIVLLVTLVVGGAFAHRALRRHLDQNV